MLPPVLIPEMDRGAESGYNARMLIFIIALLTGALVFLAALLWFQLRKPLTVDTQTPALVAAFQKEIAELRTSLSQQTLQLERQMGQHLENNTRLLQETHRDYTQNLGNLHQRIGQLQQASQEMAAIGRDIASLQDILRSPKLRGGLGELLLAELLGQILPAENFSLQYTFKDGQKVDAVILLGEGMVPVDAKFPLENFRRVLEAADETDETAARKLFVSDVKKHVDAIAQKYILPEEGTFEFALMYIPAENVYYETILKNEGTAEGINEYALRKHVIPVSPNSFYAYLQAIVRGIKGLRIERSAKLILANLGQLDTEFAKRLEDFEKVGGHLSNAQSAYGKTEKRFGRIRDRLSAIEQQESRELLTE